MTLDIEGALHAWGNSRTDLVGTGKPLAKGLMRHRPRSPGRACYATVSVEDDVDGLDAEGVTSGAVVEFTVWSATDRESSRAAGSALATALLSLSRTRPVAAGVQLLMAAPVGWPEFVEDDSGEFRHTVRATVYAASV